MKFEGWVTDCRLCSFLGFMFTDDSNFTTQVDAGSISQVMEQRTWPTNTILKMLCSTEGTMVAMLDILENTSRRCPVCFMEEVSARLELSSRRNPLVKAHALFCEGFKEVRGNESKLFVVHGKIENIFLWEVQ